MTTGNNSKNMRGASAQKSVDLTGGAQTFDPPLRGVAVGSVAGTIVGQLAQDTADHSFYVLAGAERALAFKSITSAPAGCIGLY
jgi:hypothetical protein